METAQQWTAQMTDGSVLTGGTGAPTDVNVSQVTPSDVLLFTVSSDSFSDTGYFDQADNVESWYENGVDWTPVFPLTYAMADGSTLTIARNSDAVGDLLYTQV
jgi:hypothetical protein